MSSAPASLYRRHRPRSFDEVVGQEHVVRTLRNAVEQDHVHHAYLFVGSRGTGKTSMAKILAASLNCVDGPTVAPCGECDSCVSIARATSLDVMEMDAASNNSVDDIRDLRDKVGYAPLSGRRKVYILDEAHMLSTAAWNAFLKTLEEPPPNTIFVLATTEANKVLPTVVDRCHRFDFMRPGVPQILTVLRRVADSEGITVGDDALTLVARAATGSFRDALGTLEQLLAYAGAGESSIALEDVLAVLGAADADLLFGTVDAVAAGDAREALLAAARLTDSGRDLGRFFSDLEAHARSLLVVGVLGDVPPELRVTPEQDDRLAEQATRTGGAAVVRLLDMIAAALRACKDGADARTQLELALVKSASPDLDPSVKALQERVERLERGGRAGTGSASAPRPAEHRPEAPQTAAARRAPEPARPPAPAERPTAPAPQPPTAPAVEPTADRSAAAAAADAPVGRTAVVMAAQVEGQPPVAATATLPGARDVGPAEAQDAADRAARQVAADLATESDPAPAVAAVALVEPDSPGGEPSFAAGVELSLERFNELWPAVLETLRDRQPMLAALLESARPASVAQDGLTLAFPESSSFLKRKADDPTNRELIASAVRAVTGSSLRLAYELRADAEVAEAPAPAALGEEELVQRFVTEFDAELLPDEEESA